MSSLLRDRYAGWIAADIVAMKGVEQENRHLDFKLLAKPDFGADDQRHLAKAVSGFANAEGGVIVWGVDARRDPKDDYIDQVVATPGVVNPRQVLAKLNGMSSDATSPGLLGLDHRVLEGGEGVPSFVATFVPEGESGPYMAMLGEARHRYYRRIGSAFSPMDHSMVADMFCRRPKGALRLHIEQAAGGATALAVHLANVGRGPVIAPYLLFSAISSRYVVRQESPYGLKRTPKATTPGGLEGFVGGADVVIVPGLSLTFQALEPEPVVLGAAPLQVTAAFRYGAIGLQEQTGYVSYDFEHRRFIGLEGAGVMFRGG
jgi:hypothetical protein